MMITSRMPGNDAAISPIRMVNSSTFPPKYPDTRPSVIPMTSPPVNIPTNVRTTVFWIPQRRRVKTSRPARSVPAQCSRLGGSRKAV